MKCVGKQMRTVKYLQYLHYFRLGLVTTDFDVLFPVVHLSTHGGGGLVFGDGSDDPLQARLEAVMGQERPPAISDFAVGFGKRTNSAEVISGKKGGWRIFFLPSLSFEV
jgi:hypothetical protein